MDRRRWVSAALLLALVTVMMLSSGTAGAQASQSRVVVVVLSPYMTWDDLASGAVPNLREVAEGAALANLNPRSRARGAEHDSLAETALMLSAGSWTLADAEAPGAYSVDEDYETGTVADAYRRFMGADPGEAAIAYLGFPRADRANRFDTLATQIGALGGAIDDAGGLTAAIGNSDAGFATSAVGRDRPAALVAMDRAGLVDLGDVSRRILRTDEDGPFGLSTDRERFASELEKVMAAATAHEGPSLVVLDPGDSHRAVEFAEMVSEGVAEAHRLQALETLDDVVRRARDLLPARGVLMVVSTAAVGAGSAEAGLTPCVVTGEDWAGFLRSSSTHRDGLATMTDVSATVLDALDLERPVSMLGNPMEAVPSGLSFEDRIETLQQADGAAVAIEATKRTVLNAYILLTVLVIAVATAFVARGTYPGWLARTLRVTLLLSLVVPVASYAMFALESRPQGGWHAVVLFLVTTVAIWLAMLALGLGGHWTRPLGTVSMLTTVILVADAWLGSPLSYVGYLSYSPIVGARYYGMGNEAAGLLLGSLLVGVGLLMDHSADQPWVRRFGRWGLPVVGGLTVFTAAAPGLGANVGVAAWGVVCVAVMWALANGVRLSWRLVAGVLIVVVLVVGLLAVLDAGSGSGTHLARALDSAERGGFEELWLIVARKVETNVRVLTHTNWAYVLLAVLALLGFMRWKPRGEFMETLEEFPRFGDAMAALLIGGLVAYFTEDSGIVIPALMLLYPGVGVLYLMLRPGRPRTDGSTA
jgi:hypothetical protein